MYRVESWSDTADRLATQNALQRDANGRRRAEQARAADTLLGVIEHVTMWTEPNGRARHESRTDTLS